jgi:hypothetical protein
VPYQLHLWLGDDLEESLRAFAADNGGCSIAAAVRLLLGEGLNSRLRVRAEAADAYAQQNREVIRENMMLRDEIAAYRERHENEEGMP